MSAKSKDIISFVNVFSECFENNVISKIIISKVNKKNSENNEYSSIRIKPFSSKKGLVLSFVFVYPMKEITQNLSLSETLIFFDKNLGINFLQVDMFLQNESYHLLMKSTEKASLIRKKLEQKREVHTEHNEQKKHLIPAESGGFLQALGVVNATGIVQKDQSDKFRQINKFIEQFAEGLMKVPNTSIKPLRIVDMGSGKGYLTFAMMHYCKNILQIQAHVQGVERRKDMVDLCNQKAKELGFENLRFIEGEINTISIPDQTEVMVALHACDTATDDAIFTGIRKNIPVMMLAPCCHKQVRKDLNLSDAVPVWERFGSIKERIAETLTDSIRVLLLEAYGYKTQIFEFIGPENTPKNMMIRAIYQGYDAETHQSKIEEISVLKNKFGLKRHYLQEILAQW
ncbi:MAG: class I SAM-dependent methyltransferase [Leadbetterella sp.]